MKHHAHIRHNLVCRRYYPKDNNLSSLKSVLGPPALCDFKSCASVNCSLYIFYNICGVRSSIREG